MLMDKLGQYIAIATSITKPNHYVIQSPIQQTRDNDQINVNLMLGHRLRYWPNIITTLGIPLVFVAQRPDATQPSYKVIIMYHLLKRDVKSDYAIPILKNIYIDIYL